jgi:hypothetical protein
MIFGDRSTRRAVNTSGVLHKITTIHETLQIGARHANSSKVTRTHQSREANESKQPPDMSGIGCGHCVSFHIQKSVSKEETYHPLVISPQYFGGVMRLAWPIITSSGLGYLEST